MGGKKKQQHHSSNSKSSELGPDGRAASAGCPALTSNPVRALISVVAIAGCPALTSGPA